MSDVTLFKPGETALAAMSVEELRTELAASLEMSAAHLMHLAAIWAELERRGEDLSALRSGIAVYLPLIARGTIDAHLVVRYAGQNMLLRHLATLPADQQQALIEDDTIVVVEAVDGDLIETRKARSDLDTRMIRAVFADRILSPDEQRERIIEAGSSRRRSPAIAGADLAYKRHARDKGMKTFNFNVKMTPEEHARVKAYAEANGVSLGSLVRSLLSREVK